MTYIQTDMTHEETRLRAQVAGLSEAAWNLLDAISEANSARGLDEKQCARWQVDEMSQALRKALAQVEP
jgi:hypothetical protein